MIFASYKKIRYLLLALFVLALPIVALAQTQCTPGYNDVKLCIGTPGITDFPSLMEKIFLFISEIIGLAAITMLVYSGARMITANGNPDTISTAKSGFAWAIGGFAVAVLAFVVVMGIENFIGVGNIDEHARTLQNPLGRSDLQGFVGRVLNGFGVIVGILAVLMIVINGFRYVTAGGNEDQTEKAKSGLVWAVVGLMGVALAYVIIMAVNNLLSRT